ncbi:MAG: hypothetical protein RBT19_08960 [Tenuifilaceae bacterium]|nr:hypothetical protein [Tenuifilaceae bacterium]
MSDGACVRDGTRFLEAQADRGITLNPNPNGSPHLCSISLTSP